MGIMSTLLAVASAPFFRPRAPGKAPGHFEPALPILPFPELAVPVPEAVGRPTMTASPRKPVALPTPIGAAPTMKLGPAIALYIAEIQQHVGDSYLEVGWLAKDYQRFRKERTDLALPSLTDSHLSRHLARQGFARFTEDRRFKNGDQRRVSVFHIPSARQQRKLAA